MAAWGPIQGWFEAAESIGVVHSGAQITATILAPSMPAIIEYDSTIFTAYPYPDTPASVKAEVLAEAAAVFNDLVALKQEIAANIAQFFADFADAKAEEAARIIDLRADVANSVAEAIARANASLAADRVAATAQLIGLRDQARQMLHDARQAAAEDKAEVIELRDQVFADAEAAYQSALAQREQVFAMLAAGDAELLQLVTEELAASAAARDARDRGWEEFTERMAEAPLLGFRVDLTPPPAPELPISLYWHYLIHRNGSDDLDAFQFGLDVFGFVPGFGEILDVINAGISVYNGDWFGAGASLISVVPVLGDLLGKGGKLARAGVKYSDEIAEVVNAAKVGIAPKGARGPISAWEGFDEVLAGGYVRELSTNRIKVTARAIGVVEQHISRFGPDKANSVMVDRLRRIANGELVATVQDLNFYSHELREFVRYRRLGWKTGVPSDVDAMTDLWRQTHTGSLLDYGLPWQKQFSDLLLYHSDALHFLE